MVFFIFRFDLHLSNSIFWFFLKQNVLKSDFFFSKKKEILLLMELSAFFRGQRSKFCEWLFFLFPGIWKAGCQKKNEILLSPVLSCYKHTKVPFFLFSLQILNCIWHCQFPNWGPQLFKYCYFWICCILFPVLSCTLYKHTKVIFFLQILNCIWPRQFTNWRLQLFKCCYMLYLF